MIDMLSFLTEIISNDTAGACPATTNVSSHGHKTTTCSKLFPTKRSLMGNIVKTMVFTNIDLSCTVRTLSDSETITIHAAFIKGQSNLFIVDTKETGIREVGFIWISVSQGPNDVRNIEVSIRGGSTVHASCFNHGNACTRLLIRSIPCFADLLQEEICYLFGGKLPKIHC